MLRDSRGGPVTVPPVEDPTEPPPPRRWLVPVLSVLFVPIYASGFLAGKIATAHMAVPTVLLWRFLIALAVVLVAVVVMRPAMPARPGVGAPRGHRPAAAGRPVQLRLHRPGGGRPGRRLQPHPRDGAPAGRAADAAGAGHTTGGGARRRPADRGLRGLHRPVRPARRGARLSGRAPGARDALDGRRHALPEAVQRRHARRHERGRADGGVAGRDRGRDALPRRRLAAHRRGRVVGVALARRRELGRGVRADVPAAAVALDGARERPAQPRAGDGRARRRADPGRGPDRATPSSASSWRSSACTWASGSSAGGAEQNPCHEASGLPCLRTRRGPRDRRRSPTPSPGRARCSSRSRPPGSASSTP